MVHMWLISQDVWEVHINDQFHPGEEKKIKEAHVATRLTKQISQTIKDVEKLLLVWINEQQ